MKFKFFSIFRTDERTNGCDKCDADFKDESALENHKSTKSYEKGVSRNCPNCSFKFCERTTLNRHLREVHKLKTIKNEPLDAEPGEKVRKWVCDKCDYAYYNSSHLDDHQKSKGNFLFLFLFFFFFHFFLQNLIFMSFQLQATKMTKSSLAKSAHLEAVPFMLSKNTPLENTM